jgi:hypothetical protein
MAGEIVASNVLLKDRAENLRTLFSSGHSLRLYQNDLKPTPADTLVRFIEASYVGYERVNMDEQWKAVLKIIDGQYQFSSKDQLYLGGGSPTAPVYGWYLVGENKVKLSCRLPFPVFLGSGKRLTVRVDVIVWDAGTLCP